jgi:peptidoglycan hydrolase CwlO-like protein
MKLATLFLGCGLLFLLGVFISLPPQDARAQFLSEEERARLEAEYAKIQAEIAEWQAILNETRDKKDSLQGDVNELNALINKASAEIRQRNVTITNLRDQISIKESTIQELAEKIERGKVSLANILRIQNTADDQSVVEIVLSAENFSETFGVIDALAVVKRDLQHMFAEIRSLRDEVELEKAALAAKQNQEFDARYEIELSRKQIQKNEATKAELLAIAKNEERTYEEVLAERQRRAEQIRNALFPLRDAEGISFADALNYATYAEGRTGIRAAFILAILSQESDLGKNVGSCFVTSLSTGDGVGKNTGRVFEQVMKAPRDTEPFERITRALGLTWGATPVSCPPGLKYYSGRGFGGAMGPSQFIPSTWVLYEERLATALGVPLPNPWDAQHAVMATALFMSDLGAGLQTYTAERNAACRYYSGRSCDNRSPRNSFYGDSVIAKAEQFQEDIDFLKGLTQ